ncbi:TPA: hypothetical protein HA241_07405 [Candidatus Woesearchaeota archaeon]|nr:hypothetical protein [Candidatus Woesearchaeota archaeon]
MYRKKDNQARYVQTRKDQSSCPFCEKESELLKRELTYFNIWLNKFSYDVWDHYEVDEHLMIIPKRHLNDFAEFSEEESREYFEILKEYSKKGYDSFTRNIHSKIRTKKHIHTHLIKTNDKRIKKLIYRRELGYIETEF